MTKLVLILLTMLLSVQSVSAQSKRKKPAIDDIHTVTENPCGVRQSISQVIDEAELEWRSAALGSGTAYFYNTRRIICDSKTKTLKVWVKGVRETSKTTASMSRYELDCRGERLKTLSTVEYYENGRVSNNFEPTNPKWSDATPETVGYAVLVTVCHKDF